MANGMGLRLQALLLLLFWFSGPISCASWKKTTAPDYSKMTYMVGGTLKLPYAELAEPFMAYYDGKANPPKSRIDYYDGTVLTMQRGDLGDYGISYKVAYMSTESVLNKRTCFQMNGTADGPVLAQSILPDLKGFSLLTSTTILDGVECDVWQNITVRGMKKNTYTFWVKHSNQEPVRYEMMGYDSLLGSHYDKYYVEYKNFNSQDQIPASTWNVPAGLTCGGFPGPGVEASVLMNPMKEYISNDDSHVHEMYEHFKKTYSKEYKDDREHEKRKTHFRHNVRFIHSKNRAGLTYTLKVNHLADKSHDEIKIMLGRKPSHGYNGGKAFNKEKYMGIKMPDQYDWRLYGAVTPVKDQAICGSCWSFGTTGTLEGALFRKSGKLIRLSQQQLMDCSWGEGNNACDGGEDFRAYQWIMKNGGISAEEDYGPYLMQDGKCHNSTAKATKYNIKSYVNITSGDLDALKMAIYNVGPISVAIDASHLSLSFYGNGVYYEPKCGNTDADLDHAVLAVGYGIMQGQPYWLIKNSWSTYWGNDGYVLMSQKNNNCGVATSATHVNM